MIIRLYIYMYVVNLCNCDRVILCIVCVCSLLENFHVVINDNFLQDKGGGMSGPSLPVPVELVSGDVFNDAPEQSAN